MAIPPSITSGVDAVWVDAETVDVFGDAVTSSTHSLVYYFRLNAEAEGLQRQQLLTTVAGRQLYLLLSVARWSLIPAGFFKQF